MGNVQVLDCTLRDGGYCNQWRFGNNNISKIIDSLIETGIDVIECGFLSNKVKTDSDMSRYADFEQLRPHIPINHAGKLMVVMANYGECLAADLPECKDSPVDGIRVAFHKKDVAEALNLCEDIKSKGYSVFVQAMVSLNYSDREFLDLISKVNDLKPYAFYIVDSFGMMKRKDLMRLFYLVENNLKESIKIGFHSHNNLQLAYSNAQALVETQSARDLIIDSSIYGMGRGAGNLNTELFIQYLNETIGTSYYLNPILNLMDEVLEKFYRTSPWGYTLPNYLSAAHNAHPNYAGYLSEKNTLTVESMNEIFDMMDGDKKSSYDKDYIEELYIRYMETGKAQEQHRDDLHNAIGGKTVLVIGPGMSSEDEKTKISDYAKNNSVISIDINFNYPHINTDYTFVSNIRRFRELDPKIRSKCIITSNIPADGIYLQTDYRELLNDEETVRDNAGLMLIKFLIAMDVKRIVVAGLDGYSHDILKNYAEEQMIFISKKAFLDATNEGMSKMLAKFSKMTNIEFLTKPRYYKVG